MTDAQLAAAIRRGVAFAHLLYLAPDNAGPLARQAAEEHRRQCPSCRAWLARNAKAAWKQKKEIRTMATKISWTNETWNPLTGCTKVSPGCAHCYAERMAKRLKAMGQPQYQDAVDDKGRWTGKITLVPERLEDPLKWKRPRRIFVNSMSDLFHKDVSELFINRVVAVMAIARQHKYQILTKQADKMAGYFSDSMTPKYVEEEIEYLCGLNGWCAPDFDWPLSNVQLGVSCEDQKRADERIPWLLKTPAAVRFVSIEPMLGPIDLKKIHDQDNRAYYNAIGRARFDYGEDGYGVAAPMPERLSWIVAGCESGPNARPANPDWFRSLRDQCQAAGVAFYLKQMMVDGKLVHLPELDGRTWEEYPSCE